MKKKYNFVYLTTNLINGKQYIGDHSTDNLNDMYYGSGILICKAIKRYNIKNFNRLILEKFETKAEAFNAQEKYINEYNTVFPNGYNISPKGGNQISGGLSSETKEKISKKIKTNYINNPEILIKISKSQKGKKLTDDHKQKISKSLIGKITSSEHSLHLSESLKNRKFSEEHKKKLSKSHKNKETWMKGKKHSIESIKKISESIKNKEKIECEHCHKKISKGNYIRWHGRNCKHINNI